MQTWRVLTKERKTSRPWTEAVVSVAGIVLNEGRPFPVLIDTGSARTAIPGRIFREGAAFRDQVELDIELPDGSVQRIAVPHRGRTPEAIGGLSNEPERRHLFQVALVFRDATEKTNGAIVMPMKPFTRPHVVLGCDVLLQHGGLCIHQAAWLYRLMCCPEVTAEHADAGEAAQTAKRRDAADST